MWEVLVPDTVLFLLLVVAVAAAIGGPVWAVRKVQVLTRRRWCPHRPALHHPGPRGRLRCEMCGRRPAPPRR
jgi:hypothetical protein